MGKRGAADEGEVGKGHRHPPDFEEVENDGPPVGTDTEVALVDVGLGKYDLLVENIEVSESRVGPPANLESLEKGNLCVRDKSRQKLNGRAPCPRTAEEPRRFSARGAPRGLGTLGGG